ncbi:MAG: transcription elongation GreA/GreB family factor [Granulosicoccus sp.]
MQCLKVDHFLCEMNLDLKKTLYSLCENAIEQRVAHAKEALSLAQESANDETKSSAGDKHETGRAMAQLEAEKANAQLNQAMNLKHQLEKLDASIQTEKVVIGSLVICKTARFLLTVSAGKLEHEGQTYFAISADSPIGKLLLGKVTGDSITFNGITHEIVEIT